MSGETKAQVRERPILFSAPMMLALLAGTKTQTRRVVQLPKWIAPEDHGRAIQALIEHPAGLGLRGPCDGLKQYLCPYGKAGEHLWCRETWRAPKTLDALSPTAIGTQALEANYRQPWAPVRYEADGAADNDDVLAAFGGEWGKTRVSIHMPRWASRLTLRVTEVRVERLHAISEADARAEGVGSRAEFEALWRQINGEASWAENPWVWVVGVKRVQP